MRSYVLVNQTNNMRCCIKWHLRSNSNIKLENNLNFFFVMGEKVLILLKQKLLGYNSI